MKKHFTYIKKLILFIFVLSLLFTILPRSFSVDLYASSDSNLRNYASWEGQALLEKHTKNGITSKYSINPTSTLLEIKSNYEDENIIWNSNKKNYIYFSNLYDGINDIILKNIGNSNNTYIVIENAYDLYYFSRACFKYPDLFLGLNYLLGCNIDYSTIPSSYEFYPIGFLANKPFSGTFNGQGFEISNLVMVSIDSDEKHDLFMDLQFFAPFSRLSQSATISYLGMINLEVYLTASIQSMHYVSGLVGYNEGTVHHVFYRDERVETGSFGGQGFKVSDEFTIAGLISRNNYNSQTNKGTLDNAYVAVKSLHFKGFGSFNYNTNQFLICSVSDSSSNEGLDSSTIFYDSEILTSDTRKNPLVGQGGTPKNTDNFLSYSSNTTGLNSPVGFTDWFFSRSAPTAPNSDNYYNFVSIAYYSNSLIYPSLSGFYINNASTGSIYTPSQLIAFPRVVEEKSILKDKGNTTSFTINICADLDMNAVSRNAYIPPRVPFTKYLKGQVWNNSNNYKNYQLYERGTSKNNFAEKTTVGGNSNCPTIFNLNLSNPIKYDNIITYGLLGYYTNHLNQENGYLNFVNAKIEINPSNELLIGAKSLGAGIMAGYTKYISSLTTFSHINGSVDIEVTTNSNLPMKTSVGGIIGESYGNLSILYTSISGNISLGDNKINQEIKELNVGGLLGSSSSSNVSMQYVLSHADIQGAGKIGDVDRNLKLNIGGIAGSLYRGGVTSFVYCDGTVTSMKPGGQVGYLYLGGIFGKNHSNINSVSTFQYITFSGVINTQLPTNITNQIDFYVSGITNVSTTDDTFLQISSGYTSEFSVSNYGSFNFINRDSTKSKSNTYSEYELERFKGNIAGIATFLYGFRSPSTSYGVYNYAKIDADLSLFNTVSGLHVISLCYYTSTDGTITSSPNWGNNYQITYEYSYGSKGSMLYNFGDIILRSYNTLTDYDYDISGIKSGMSFEDFEGINYGNISIFLNNKSNRLLSSTPYNYSGAVNYHNYPIDSNYSNRAINMYVGGIYSYIYQYASSNQHYYNKGNIAVYTNGSFIPNENNSQSLNLMVGGIYGSFGGYPAYSNYSYGVSAYSPNNGYVYSNYCVNEGNINVSTKIYGEVIVGGIAGVKGVSYNETYVYSSHSLFQSYNIGDIYVENYVQKRKDSESFNPTFGVTAGGLVGSIISYNLFINNCANYGTVVSISKNDIEFSKNVNNHEFYTTGVSAGGIVGLSMLRNYGVVTYSNTPNTQTHENIFIQDTINYGNIYAYAPNSIINSNYSTFLPASSGGILGRGAASIMFCINYGRVYSSFVSGGIIGLFSYEPIYSTLTNYQKGGMIWGLINYGDVGYLNEYFNVTLGETNHSGIILNVTGLVEYKPADNDFTHGVGGIIGKIRVNDNRLINGLWYPNKISTASIYFFRIGGMLNLNPKKNGIGIVPPADSRYFDSNSLYFGKQGRLNRYNVTLNKTDTTGNTNLQTGNGSPFYFNYIAPNETTSGLFNSENRFRKNPQLSNSKNMDLEYSDNYLEELFTKYFLYIPWSYTGDDINNTLTGFLGNELKNEMSGLFVLAGYSGIGSTTNAVEYFLGSTEWLRNSNNGLGRIGIRPSGDNAEFLNSNAVIKSITDETKSMSNRDVSNTYISMLQAKLIPSYTPNLTYSRPSAIYVNAYNDQTGDYIGQKKSSRYIDTPLDPEYEGIYEVEITEGSNLALERVGYDSVSMYTGLKAETYIKASDAFAMGLTMPYTNIPLGYYTSQINASPQNQFYLPYLGNYVFRDNDYVQCGPFGVDGVYNIIGSTPVINPTLNTYRSYYSLGFNDNRSNSEKLEYPITMSNYNLYEKNGVALKETGNYDIIPTWSSTLEPSFGAYKYDHNTDTYSYAGPNVEETYVKISINDDTSSISYFSEPYNAAAIYKYSMFTNPINGTVLTKSADSGHLKDQEKDNELGKGASLLRSYGPYGSGVLEVTRESAINAGIQDLDTSDSPSVVLDLESDHNGFITIKNNITSEIYKYQIRIKRVPAQTMDELWYSTDSTGYSIIDNSNIYLDDSRIDNYYNYDRRISSNSTVNPNIISQHLNPNIDIKDFYCEPTSNSDYALLDTPIFTNIPNVLTQTGYIINNYDGNPNDRSELDIESYYQSKYKVAYRAYMNNQIGSAHNDSKGINYAGYFSFIYRTNNLPTSYMTNMYNNMTMEYITRNDSGEVISAVPTTNFKKSFYQFGTKQTKPDPLFGTWGPGNFGFSISFPNPGLPGEYRMKFTLEDGTEYYLSFHRDYNDGFGIWNSSSINNVTLSNQYYSYTDSGTYTYTSYSAISEINKSNIIEYSTTIPYGSFYDNGVSGSSSILNFTNYEAINNMINSNKGTDIGIPVESFYFNNMHGYNSSNPKPDLTTRHITFDQLNNTNKLIPSNLETTNNKYIYFAEYCYFVGVDIKVDIVENNYGYTVNYLGIDYTKYITHKYIVTYLFASQRDIQLLGDRAKIKKLVFTINENRPNLNNEILRDGTNIDLSLSSNKISFPKNETPRFRVSYTLGNILNNKISHPIVTTIDYLGSDYSMFENYYDDSNIAYTFTGYEISFPKKSRPGEYKITQMYQGYDWSITFNGINENINSEFYYKQYIFEKSANKDSRLAYIGFDTEYPVMSGNNIIGKWHDFTGSYDYIDDSTIPNDNIHVDVLEGGIMLDAYKYYMTEDGRIDRPMNIGSLTGIDYSKVDEIYGTYTTNYTSNIYYLVGQVQKTNLSHYSPIFNLPELSLIARITDEDNKHNPYVQETQYKYEYKTISPGTPEEYEDYVFIVDENEQNDPDNPSNYVKNPNFYGDFAGEVEDNELYYVHYRVYAEAYSFDELSGENNGYYTDYYVSVQDATNNVYFNLEVVTDELSSVSRFNLPQTFITFYAFSNDSNSVYNGALMLEMSLFSLFRLNGVDDREQVGENLQFRNVMGGHYVVSLDLPIGYDFYITSSSKFVIPDGINEARPTEEQINEKWEEHNVKSFNISKSIVLRKYPITIHIYENGEVEEWGQIGIFPYIPNS